MDFFRRLPEDVFERILYLLDLPEINIARLIDKGFNSFISDHEFGANYNRNRISRLWVFSHVCEGGDDTGVLMAYRVDNEETEMILDFPLDIAPIQFGDRLKLFNVCGSIFLFTRQTPHPDDEDNILVSLCLVNPFRRLVHSVVQLPNGLVFDAIGSVRLSIEQQHFTISYLFLNENHIPTFSLYRSATNQWECLLLEAAPIPENQPLNPLDPRAMIHTQDEITYFVSFLDGQLVFKTVLTNILIGNTFQGLPVPHAPHGRIMAQLLVARGDWAFMLFCHSPQHLPHLSSIAAVALAKIRPNWTAFDLIDVTPPHIFTDDLVYIRFDADLQLHQTGRHVNLGLVTSDLRLVPGIRTFSYDLLSREWGDHFVPYDEDSDVAPPLCSSMLTL